MLGGNFWIYLGGVAALVTIIGFTYYLIDRHKSKTVGNLKTYYGETKIIFGSNRFTGCPNILVVNNKPIFTATVKQGTICKNRKKLLVSIIIFDRNNNIVAQIENNRWILNQNNFLRKEITKDEVKVYNQQGELSLHCKAHKDGSVTLNGTFYAGGNRFYATDNGLQIN